jgi:predicted ATP-grasp superfamily ATP-dependent carboligase
MKAIVTKYALTSGCTLADGEVSMTEGRKMLVAEGRGFVSRDYYHGNDFHLTKVEAIIRVQEMADNLRASLTKRLAAIDKSKTKALKQIEGMDL